MAIPSQPSLWQATAPRAERWPQLTAIQTVEIAIVGAGIAGLSLALHLGALGQESIVVEAQEEGSGAAGSSGGLIVPYLTRHTPASVQAHFGQERADKLLRLVSTAANYTFELIGDARQACGAMQSGFLAPVRGAAAVAKLKDSVSTWQSIRSGITLLDAADTRAATGCRGYDAALFDPSGGALNPLAYARFLAGEAARCGATIFTHSPVIRLQRTDNGWSLETARGRINARVVILCANGGNSALHPALARTILPMAITQVATGALSGNLRARILPNGEALTDLQPDVFSIRYDTAGRLITAYPDRNGGRLTPQLNTRVNRRLTGMLPAYRPTPLEYAWQGTAWLNANLLPRVVSVDTDLLAVQACNGRGLALNTVLGREIAEWLLEGRSRELIPALQPPQPIARYFLARRVPNLLLSAALTAQRLRGWLQRPATRIRGGLDDEA